MKNQMKKSMLLLSLSCLLASTAALATGTFGGNPGDISKMKSLLEANWNGKPGIQNTVSYGVIVQWTADVCGALNGHITDTKTCTKTIKPIKQK